VKRKINIILIPRNIVAINLIQSKNLRAFVKSATEELLLPIKLNMFGVASLLIALLCYCYSVLGRYFFFFFLFLLAVPALFIIFYVSSKAVKKLYHTQPWYQKKLTKWIELDEKSQQEQKEEKQRVDKLKKERVHHLKKAKKETKNEIARGLTIIGETIKDTITFKEKVKPTEN
jgi:hypothetical protein